MLHGVIQQWDKHGGERYRTYRFPGRQTIYRDGKPGGKGNWLNMNACYQIDGPDEGVCYEYDGAFYKLIFSRVFASWANK